MSRQYTLRNFLRRAPQALLRDYLAQQGLGNDIDWKYSPDIVASVFDVIHEASTATEGAISLAFQEINDLADESGVLAILDEAREPEHGLDLTLALKDMGSCYEKAFWVYMNHPGIFKSARVIDTVSDRRSVKRGGFPLLTNAPDEASNERLGKALSDYYLKRDGRGQGCNVDHYVRGDNHIFCVYLEGFAHANIVYDENHKMKNDTSRPAFEIIFRYNSTERTLEISGASGKRILNELQIIFSETVLRNHISAPPDRQVYGLNGLRDRDFDPRVDFDPSIRCARVKKMKVSIWGKQGITLTIDVGKDYGLSDIHNIIDAIVAAAKVPNGNVEVKQAGFGLTFYPEDGKRRGKSLTFSVSDPDTTSLKEGKTADDKARRCIVEWGIDISGSATGVNDEPPLAAQSLIEY